MNHPLSWVIQLLIILTSLHIQALRSPHNLLYNVPSSVSLLYTQCGPPWDSRTSTALYQMSPDHTLATFEQLVPPPNTLPDWLLNRCVELGYTSPTIVQEASLPAVFAGEDVVLQAQTGSGKTLAYCLPVLSKIDPKRAAIQAVIVVPSRELGLQVAGVLKQLSSGSPEKIMVMTLVEGSKNKRQQLWAVAEPPHIVVGNPKSLQRIVDLGRLRLNAVSFVVVDEVDACLISPETRLELHTLLSRRLSSTFQTSDDNDGAGLNDMKEDLVYTNLAKDRRDVAAAAVRYRNSRQTILCSATIPQRQHFAVMCQKEGWTETLPRLIHVTPEELVPRQVRHEYVDVPEDQRLACLKFVLKKEIQSWADDTSDINSGSSISSASSSSSSSDSSSSSSSSMEGTAGSDAPTAIDTKRQGLLRRRKSSADKVELAGPPSTPPAASDVPAAPREGSFQAVIFVDDGPLAAEVCATAAATLAASSSSSAVGGVSYLSDSGSLDERAKALNAFRDGTSSILVCSDIASRGLDVPNVSHVFQMKLPETVDEYIHKVGRAGRLGRRGKAITFCATEEAFVVQRFSNELGVKIQRRAIKTVKKD